jgi:hypothetical protein|tara:strand:- start:748 stop:993 length:246 start_codon:yes stop_codon:yes gene_type:complete
MNDANTYKKLKNNLNKLHSFSIVNKKIYLLIPVFILNISLAFAQTGLFTGTTATQFAVTGIIIIVLIIVIQEIFKKMFRKK